MSDTRKLDELTPAERKKALLHFRLAVKGRIEQWDNEQAIERLLGREIELDMPDIAACTDDPMRINLASLKEALGE